MARNPKDLVVAYYQFHRSLRTMSYRGTFQEFCRRFMNDKRECASPNGRPARPARVLVLGPRWSQVVGHARQGRRPTQTPCLSRAAGVQRRPPVGAPPSCWSLSSENRGPGSTGVGDGRAEAGASFRALGVRRAQPPAGPDPSPRPVRPAVG